MSDMPREIWAIRTADQPVPEIWDCKDIWSDGTAYILKSEHAKLEAANKVLYKALQYYLEPDMPLKSTAQAALKAADGIMKENG